MIMNNFVSDDLANKVFQLSKALHQAEHIIEILSQENDELRKLLEYNQIPEIPAHTSESCVLSY